MSFLVTTFSLILGLYFLRGNILFSILITISYFAFVLWRFGKRKFIIFVLFFGIGVLVPRINLQTNNDSDYGGIVIDARDNYIIFLSKFEKYYVYTPENDYEIGDVLKIKGTLDKLNFSSYESQFNFQNYLANKNIKSEIVVNSIDVNYKSIIKIHRFKTKFLSNFDENSATLISAFLFNDKDFSNSIIQLADRCEILYLFSLSGIYLNILFAAADYLLQLKLSKKKSKILTFIIFLPLAFFSFTKIGTIRVYALYLLKYLNEFHFKRRKFSHIELVSILALIFIGIDYSLVYQEAFYIGFLLSAFSPIILSSIKCIDKKKRKYASFLIFNLISLIIHVRSGSLNFLYPLISTIILPYNVFFLLMSILSLCLPFYKFVEILTKGEMWILEKMDVISIHVPFWNWNGAFAFILIGVITLIVFYLESMRFKHVNIAVTCLLALITVSIAPFQDPFLNAVYFVNVGQGDSIIIKNKSKTVMIDTGGSSYCDMAKDTLIPFMNKNKITHIDALILSHDDFDHSGAKESLIENFKVSQILTTKEQFPFQIEDLYIENLNNYNATDSNDSSLILKMTFMNKIFLFTGDSSSEIEKKIIKDYNVDCDILKVGHHGSKYSTCEEFIKATSPKEAVISVGANNFYGHPNDLVLENLKKYNVKIRRTDLEGTICYFSLFT